MALHRLTYNKDSAPYGDFSALNKNKLLPLSTHVFPLLEINVVVFLVIYLCNASTDKKKRSQYVSL